MRRIAIATCWLVIAANLYGTFQLGQANAAGFWTILPMLLFGLVLLIHYNANVHIAAVWLALIFVALWGFFGLIATGYLLFGQTGMLGMALFMGALTLLPAIPNVVELLRRTKVERAHAV